MLHKDLAAGRWFELTLAEQMGNIGSEVSRARRWQGKDQERFEGALKRADELFTMTLQDARWRHRLKELCRAKEVFWDAALGGTEYGSTFENLMPYFDWFALAARCQSEAHRR